MRNRSSKEGFTLVELSLSVAFIGILSIAVALIINDTIAAYRRGMILNQINTVGIDLVDDLRAAVQNSPIRSASSICNMFYTNKTLISNCVKDGAKGFTSIEKWADVTVRGDPKTKNVPVFGAFCTGSYSYIWNSGYFFAEGVSVSSEPAVLRYNDGSGTEQGVTFAVNSNGSPFRLIKVKDNMRAVCMSVVGLNSYRKNIPSNVNEFDIHDKSYPVLGSDDINEVLISDSGNNLVLYDLRSAAPAMNAAGNGELYSVSFVLGTITGGIDVAASGNYCVPPKSYSKAEFENFDYCSINKFNFAVQATGE